MTGQNIGYRRVSSTDQNLDRQLDDIKLDEVFSDKQSGKNKNRPGLEDCLRYCRKGDTLHVHSMDRLARNLRDLQNIVEDLNQRYITVNFHKENLIFSGGENPMQKMMLQVMGSFAELERNLIIERQKEGIEAAKKRGVLIGSKPKLSKEQEAELINRVNQPGANRKALSAEYGITRQTLYNILKRQK